MNLIIALLELPEKFRPERRFEPDLCDASAMPVQFNWKKVVTWVHCKPVDAKFDISSIRDISSTEKVRVFYQVRNNPFQFFVIDSHKQSLSK